MATETWVLFSMMAASAAVACGGGGDGVRGTPRAAVDAGVLPVEPREPAPAAAADAGPRPGAPPDAAPAPAHPEEDGGPAPSCVPDAGPDEPDEAFTDSNCDGIDGDVTAAVFVSPVGSDGAAGTPSEPVATLVKAVALAADQGKSVYVCNGDYPENVVLDGKAPAGIHGGYDCTNGWRRVLDRAVVNPPSGVPITVTGVAAPLVLDRLALRAADAQEAGGSSIAAVVAGSPGVRFLRAELSAGNAANGTNGALVPAPVWSRQAPAEDAMDVGGDTGCSVRSDGTGPQGGLGCLTRGLGAHGAERVCPDGARVVGGAGGDGSNWGLRLVRTSGAAGTPLLAAPAPAGVRGMDGRSGSAAARGFGRVEHGRYVADNAGMDGEPGKPGFAGWGGTGGDAGPHGDVRLYYEIGGGGGQGGYPGCGGAAGRAGGAGGASIALLSENSGVALVWSRLLTGRGGDGGEPSSGAKGQPGGPGGKGGLGGGGNRNVAGKDGTPGGDGGDGKYGGPGGGGPSIGLVVVGEQPATEEVVFVLGSPGRGARSPLATAADGIGAETYTLGGDAGAGN